MLNFNLVAMADRLMIGKLDEPDEGRIEICKILLEAAVEIVNNKRSRDEITDQIVEFGEKNYGMVMPDCVLDDYLYKVRDGLKAAHWDPRIVVKIEYFNIGTVLYEARLQMDLEKTVELMGWDTPPPTPERTDILDVVEDNPSMDTINALNRFVDTRREQRVDLPPYRTAKFVRGVQRRDR